MILHARTVLIHACQGHLDPETGGTYGTSEAAPGWFKLVVVAVIGIAIGVWLLRNRKS